MKHTFPDGFIWGSATAAIQIEGATREGGRGPSQWDVFCQQHPEKIFQGATPAVACDHYHRYREDVALMKDIGHNGYRMSIAWPRIFPTGSGELNPQGVDFYQRLFDALLAAGIEPNVTLYHWDLPNALAERGGWENPQTVKHYISYARTCFELFGDRVKLWATLNEPAWTTLNGYVTALHPPCKHDYKAAIQVAHHFLLAHAGAMRTYHELGQNGQIGLVLNMSTVYPASERPEDVKAATVADGILNRWFSDPAMLGHYPGDIWALYDQCGLLPTLANDNELALFQQDTIDFIGVNYYYPHYASADASETSFRLNTSGRRNPDEDCQFSIAGLFRFVKNPRGRYTDWDWEIFPEGLYALLQRAHEYRPGIPVYVTENGIGMNDVLLDETVQDDARINFVREHLQVIHRAIQQGVNVKGYYMWSLMDNFSWINGYNKRYGFLYVDRDSLRRYKKQSVEWYRRIAEQNGF
jgi:6-phospho-beta-glucosidase